MASWLSCLTYYIYHWELCTLLFEFCIFFRSLNGITSMFIRLTRCWISTCGLSRANIFCLRCLKSLRCRRRSTSYGQWTSCTTNWKTAEYLGCSMFLTTSTEWPLARSLISYSHLTELFWSSNRSSFCSASWQ